MHLGVEGPCLRGGAQRRDRLGVASLPRERHSEVQPGIGIVGARTDHESKRALGLGEVLVLKRIPSPGEGDVACMRMTLLARVTDSRPPGARDAERDGQKCSKVHGGARVRIESSLSHMALVAPTRRARATRDGRMT